MVHDSRAAAHVAFHENRQAGPAELATRLRPTGVLIDVKSALAPASIPKGVRVWSL